MSEGIQPLRCAVVGVGANVFSMHKAGLDLDKVEIVGMCDIREEIGKERAAKENAPFFNDYETMLKVTEPEVAVVIVPHYLHADYTIKGFEAGAHVLVEKPMAVQVSEATAMIEAAKKHNKVLAVNFQQRTRPEIVAAKKLIDEGKLGKIQHADIKITWTRTALYYKIVDWRGTWQEEGGAVLMNQAPHELDLLTYFLGMPKRVFGWTRTIVHDIACEDTFQAMCEWDNGAMASLHISTAEAGQPQRFEIMGTGGYLSISPGKIHFQQFDTPVDEFIRTSDQAFAAPNLTPVDVPFEPSDEAGHARIYHNLYAVLREGAPLVADGETSIRGLELANGITYSSYANRPVEFPLDRTAYASLLDDLRAGRPISI